MPAFVVVCALLAVAGAAKLRAPGPARDSLALVGIRVPAGAVRALGAGELAIGALAAIHPAPVSAGLVALAYAGFGGFVVVVLRSAREPADCGCFGEAGPSLGPIHAGLNAVAAAIAVAAVLDPPHGVSWIAGRPPLIAVPLALGTITAALAAYLAFTAFPAAWRAYGSAEVAR